MEFDYSYVLESVSPGYLAVTGLIGLFVFVSMCFLYKKAGEPWWAPIIPIYNVIVFLRIAGMPWWWLLLFLIPVANVVLMIIAYVNFVKNFGRPGAAVLLLLFFPYIYIPYLAFSKNVQYVGGGQQAAA